MTTTVLPPAHIHQLTPLVANQIAAGEVIERPASVVKELLENALDAAATQLDLYIEQGGTQKIQLTDNGAGIHGEDLPLALQRHATSKLHDSDQLMAIATLGFRGEALASIASVAKVTLSSKVAEASSAWQLHVDPMVGRVTAPEPTGHARGTTVLVTELFANVPARRQFLRSTRTEMQHIEEMVKRVALSRPGLAIKLVHDGKILLNYAAARGEEALAQRVRQILGPAFMRQAMVVQHTAVGLSCVGWLGPPELARSQSDSQYLYVNGRMVRDKLLNHAIRQSYADKLYPGRYPVYVLLLTVEPEAVDVNVHPTKHEVRFRQARLVHDFVTTALWRAWPEQNATTAQEITEPVLSKPAAARSEPVTPPAQTRMPQEAQTMSLPPLFPAVVPSGSRQNWRAPASQAASAQHYVYLSLGAEWLVVQQQQGLVCVHVHAALAICAEQAWEAAAADPSQLACRPLLLPETVVLAPEAIQLLQDRAETLAQLGFDFAVLGAKEVVLRQVPAVVRFASGQRLLTQAVQLLQQQADDKALRRGLACCAAPQRAQDWTESDRQALLHHVLAQAEPSCCAHGFKNKVVLGAEQLSALVMESTELCQ